MDDVILQHSEMHVMKTRYNQEEQHSRTIKPANPKTTSMHKI